MNKSNAFCLDTARHMACVRLAMVIRDLIESCELNGWASYASFARADIARECAMTLFYTDIITEEECNRIHEAVCAISDAYSAKVLQRR